MVNAISQQNRSLDGESDFCNELVADGITRYESHGKLHVTRKPTEIPARRRRSKKSFAFKDDTRQFAYLGVEDPRSLAVHLHDQLRVHRQLSAKQQTHPVIRHADVANRSKFESTRGERPRLRP